MKTNHLRTVINYLLFCLSNVDIWILDDEEVRPFMEDPTLQLLIQYQIQTEQAKLAESDYHFDRKDFPSLVNTNDLKAINRK